MLGDFYLFKKSAMPNTELKGTNRESNILRSMGTRAFLLLGMSLLISEGH